MQTLPAGQTRSTNARQLAHRQSLHWTNGERLFVDFVGPFTRMKWGNSAILVTLDAFSKFVFFYPVRKISSQVVIDCLERNYFPAFGTPHSIVMDNASLSL